MSRRSRSILVAVLLLMVPLAGMARRARRKPQPKLPGPESIVWRYCQLDLQGARLSERASGSEEIQSLLVAPTRREADKVIVSDDCDIGKVTTGAAGATVTVTYKNLGALTSAGEILPPTRRKETVKFALKKSGNDWKISGPLLAPHVSARALGAYWQHKANVAADEAARQSAQAVVERLRHLQEEAAPGTRRGDVSAKPADSQAR